MRDAIIIIAIIIERVAFAVIGLLAALNGETWWAIIIAIALFSMLYGTKIKVGGKND